MAQARALTLKVGEKERAIRAEVVAIDRLMLHPANPRKHGEENLEAIRSSLRSFGQQVPLVVNEQYQVLAGNGRLVAMREEGWTRVWIAVAEGMSAGEQLAFMVADNRTSELATWDNAALATILRGMREAGTLNSTGYDEGALNVLLGELHEETNPTVTEDAAPAPPDAAVTQMGDVW